MIETIFKAINTVQDQDWAWYPFTKLKPAKDQILDTRHSIRYTAQYGLLYFFLLTIIALVGYANGSRPFGIQDVTVWILYSFIIFLGLVFLAYQFVITPAWNYRARKLRKVKNDEIITNHSG